jgi:CHAT domain-containing protein
MAENPLLRAGLALAGANQRRSAATDEDDGILTAEEVASLNLEGAEWVVLSGCDTGEGEVRAGEGVLGLRRAFRIAGADTLIASLWPVEDEATRQWMTALYQSHFGQGRSTAESVASATAKQLRARRAKGLSTHPFYWGSFVAVGNWR